MPGPILTVGAVAMCSHGGKLTFVPNPKLMLTGQPAAQWMPTVPVAGCANPPPPVSTGPDAMIALLPPSFSVKVTCNGQPLMIQTMAGMGNSGFPMLPVVSAGQMKVIVT